MIWYDESSRVIEVSICEIFPHSLFYLLLKLLPPGIYAYLILYAVVNAVILLG